MSTRQIAYVGVLAALYVIIGQFTRYLPNPMGGGSTIALNMVVIVIAGILLGRVPGMLVGLVGTGLNALFTSGTGSGAFELAAVIPHTIMGFSAGLARRAPAALAALTILVGHVLNLLAFVVARLLPFSEATAFVFSAVLLVEVVIDVVVISLVVPLLRPLVKQTAPE